MSERPEPPQEPAHDILAAEEFAVPTGDPTLRPGPVQLPDDPTGITEPHDVLAAEEFAMPAGPLGHSEAPPGESGAGRGRGRLAALVAGAVAAGATAFAVLRRRRS